MKFRTHAITESMIFPLFYMYAGFNMAVIILLFHFIPSLDYIMKLEHFHANLHRKLFHNLFVLAVALMIAYHYVPQEVLILCGLNFLLHVLMDSNHKGVAIFYPLSEFRLKLYKG